MKIRSLNKSIRTEYIRIEDRIRLIGSDADDEFVAVWLTLRMLQRMVPELSRILEQAKLPLSAVNLTPQAPSSATATEPEPELVEDGAEVVKMLPSSVNIAATAKAVRLTFITDDEKILVELSHEKMSQWLLLLREGYKRGEWPDGVWSAAAVSDKPPVLH